jgi:hypothetical protein
MATGSGGGGDINLHGLFDFIFVRHELLYLDFKVLFADIYISEESPMYCTANIYGI